MPSTKAIQICIDIIKINNSFSYQIYQTEDYIEIRSNKINALKESQNHRAYIYIEESQSTHRHTHTHTYIYIK